MNKKHEIILNIRIVVYLFGFPSLTLNHPIGVFSKNWFSSWFMCVKIHFVVEYITWNRRDQICDGVSTFNSTPQNDTDWLSNSQNSNMISSQRHTNELKIFPRCKALWKMAHNTWSSV